jgi:glycosyltransferase involved in cell wall biosynthesis
MKKREKQHVVYILTKLELGGAQKVCLSLLNGVRNKDISSSLITGSTGALLEETKQFNSVYYLDSLKREVGLRTLFSELKTFIQMIRLLNKMKKEHANLIVHTHSTKAGLLGRWAAFFAGVKERVHTVHGFGFHKNQSKIAWGIIYFCEWITAFITSHFVCVAKVDQEIGSRLLPSFAVKSSIIRAAVDWNRFYQPAVKCDGMQKEKEKTSFVFGTISCFKPQKNLFDLLKAFSFFLNRLQKDEIKNVQLQIIGDGVQRGAMEAWIKEKGLEKNIILLGWQKDVAPLLRSFDVFTMSSLWEGLPCAIIEARLSKLPVLAYDVGGISEVIQDGRNGFLVHPGDWRTLTLRMEQLYKNRLVQQKTSCYADDLSEFSDQAMVKGHIHLYRHLK